LPDKHLTAGPISAGIELGLVLFLLFSLLAGNFDVETGSQMTASTTKPFLQTGYSG